MRHLPLADLHDGDRRPFGEYVVDTICDHPWRSWSAFFTITLAIFAATYATGHAISVEWLCIILAAIVGGTAILTLGSLAISWARGR